MVRQGLQLLCTVIVCAYLCEESLNCSACGVRHVCRGLRLRLDCAAADGEDAAEALVHGICWSRLLACAMQSV